MFFTLLGYAGCSFIIFWLSVFCGILILPHIWNGSSLHKKWKDTRKRISVGPLGLKNRRRTKGHSIIDMNQFRNFDDYINSLNRSARRNLRDTDKNLKKHSIVHETKDENWIFTFEHLKVIFDHQMRNDHKNKFKVIIKTWIRMIGMNVTFGSINEYYHVDIVTGEKNLIAFSQPVIKGNTYRAMWFYQLSEFKRCSIWFHSLRFAINHVIKDKHLRYIDLGPSFNVTVKDHKEKFGLEYKMNWRDICDYSGDLRSLTVEE